MSSQVRRKVSDDKPLRVALVGEFRDYAPVLELVAERWEELETATGDFLLVALADGTTTLRDFWRSLAPYLSRLFPLEDEIPRIL